MLRVIYFMSLCYAVSYFVSLGCASFGCAVIEKVIWLRRHWAALSLATRSLGFASVAAPLLGFADIAASHWATPSLGYAVIGCASLGYAVICYASFNGFLMTFLEIGRNWQ